ncbi:MAG: hypothetical protein P8129_04295, partial [Anaerolineae bacterium]
MTTRVDGQEVDAQDWLQAKARLMPNLLPQAPPWVRSVFKHAWAPMRALSEAIQPLPDELWPFLLGQEGGMVAVRIGESSYVPGPATVGRLETRNVAYISVEDLAQDNEQPLHILGHLIDHYLGCGGAADGRWLSEGGGLFPHWQEAGQRLPDLFALGYGVDEVAQANARDYFARSLAWYCREREELNVADPQIDKWFRS